MKVMCSCNKNIIILLILIWIVQVNPSRAQQRSTFDQRRILLLRSLGKANLNERGKHGLPKACARLWNNPNDTVATNYIAGVLHNPNQSMFDFPGIALALGKYWKSFTPAQIDLIKKDLEKLAKPNKVGGGQGFLGHGTENHATMMWASAYLFAQYFPDAKWANGWSSVRLKAEMKERMRKTFQNMYRHGYAEYLSTTYEVIMNSPIDILLEFAEDPEMKSIARAYLIYKWSLLSLNNFDGSIIAPYARMIAQEDASPRVQYDFNVPTLYANWLYWGWGESTSTLKISSFENQAPTSHAIYCALIDIKPDDVFLRIGNDKSSFTGYSSASTFGEYGTGIPKMIMRKFYRTSQYAIGTGNFQWVPGGDYADHDTNPFNIIWSSKDRFNYINCTHPFWYSDGDEKDRSPDTWYNGGASPFMQTAQYKNVAIALFDIPEKDPWPGKPNAQKWAWRDGHSDNLIARGMLRYPKSVDESIQKDGWIFLRENQVYVGIKPLKSFYVQKDLKGMGLDGFDIVKSDHARTGFIFEVGTINEYKSFEIFQKKLISNRLNVDWKTLSVEYSDSQSNNILIKYQPGLHVEPDVTPSHLSKKGIKGLAQSVPVVSINSKPEISVKEWPMIKSPRINMSDSRIKVLENGQAVIEVDWTGKYPRISQRL